MVTVNGIEQRLAIAQVQQVEAQPRPKVIWEDADGGPASTDLDHRRAAVPGHWGWAGRPPRWRGRASRTSWPKRVSGWRSDRIWSPDPVSAQMLGETDADEALDCDEGPDEDDE